jgi:hypothetical protein
LSHSPTAGCSAGRFPPLAPPSSAVGCLEDKPKEWDHPGKFICKSCGATSDKKSKLCKPTKIEKKKKK